MEFKTKVEKYLYSRGHFRKLAQDAFLRHHADANLFVSSINELVASQTLFLSGKSLEKIKHGLYLGDLVVSFCRSHFIASDMTLGGELVEAATIIRKQMELLSRLNELTSGLDIELLIKKTPNLKHLRTRLKRLYSDYSEIAHSASPKVMQLLGSTESGAQVFTTLYPHFQENAYTTMQHLGISALEFHIWATNFHQDNFPEYDGEYDQALFSIAMKKHEAIFAGMPILEGGTY